MIFQWTLIWPRWTSKKMNISARNIRNLHLTVEFTVSAIKWKTCYRLDTFRRAGYFALMSFTIFEHIWKPDTSHIFWIFRQIKLRHKESIFGMCFLQTSYEKICFLQYNFLEQSELPFATPICKNISYFVFFAQK